MRNHFHPVVETPNANMVAGIAWLLSTYTIRLNHRRKLFGHVFSGRYKALLVEGSGVYLRTMCDYVHLNLVRARLLTPQDRLPAYPWSSLGLYKSAREHRPQWIRGWTVTAPFQFYCTESIAPSHQHPEFRETQTH